MYFKHDIADCLPATDKDFPELPDKAAAIINSLGTNGKVKAIIDEAKRKDDFASLEKKAESIRNNFRNVIVLGTGGSTLSGQAFAALKQSEINIHFADNIDPETFSKMLAGIKLNESFFLVISKSGDTLETISQFLICFDHAATALGKKKAARHFLVITMQRNSSLAGLADEYGIERLSHSEEIGGRFSSFTNVGLLPAAIMGLGIEKIRNGAAEIIRENFANPKESSLAKGIAVNLAMMRKGFSSFIYMHYLDRLGAFLQWQRQVWAESLGKNGKGTMPIPSAGTLDQHSQLQLYLGGPKDKFFTFFYLKKSDGKNPAINPELLENQKELAYLKGKTLGDIMQAEQRATLQTLVKHGCPVRYFALEKFDEETLGALFMHFMLETIGTGIALSIDPFDQPAVEEGKIIARKLLGEK